MSRWRESERKAKKARDQRGGKQGDSRGKGGGRKKVRERDVDGKSKAVGKERKSSDQETRERNDTLEKEKRDETESGGLDLLRHPELFRNRCPLAQASVSAKHMKTFPFEIPASYLLRPSYFLVPSS